MRFKASFKYLMLGCYKYTNYVLYAKWNIKQIANIFCIFKNDYRVLSALNLIKKNENCISLPVGINFGYFM